MFLRLSLLIIALGFCSNINASTPSGSNEKNKSIFSLGEYHFKNISLDHVNVDGVVSAFAEDDDGFMWIGTADGILRYDGYYFREFKHREGDQNSLGGHRINTLWKGQDGLIYIGTDANGLSVLNPKTESFTNYVHNEKNPQGITNNSIRTIIGDKHGHIWLGTNNGINRFDTVTKTFTHFQHEDSDPTSLNDNHVRSFYIDKNDQLWVGTWQGLNKFISKTQTFESVLSDPNQENSLANQIVYAMHETSDGKLWLGTADSGAAWFNPTDNPENLTLNWLKVDPLKKDTLTAHWVTAIKQINKTTLWLSTYGGGINEVNVTTGNIIKQITHDKFKVGSINQNELSNMFLDSSGLLWIANWGKGINIYNTDNAPFRTLQHSPKDSLGLSTNEILSMLELNNGNIWLGTNNNGIDIFEPNQGLVTGHRPEKAPNKLQGDGVLALAQTANGDIWVGTRHKGLYKYQPHTNDFKHFTKQDGIDVKGVTRLWASPDGDLWIASDVSFYRFNASTQEFILQTRADGLHSEFGMSINNIRYTSDGSIWVGGTQGLFVILANSNKISSVVDQKGQPIPALNQQINSLFFDDKQHMWVSNNRNKLFRIKHWRKNIIRSQDIKSIPYNKMMISYSPVFHDRNNRLWSSEGTLNSSTLESEQLDQANGIDLGNQYYGNSSKTKDGILLFGGSHGLLTIKPELYRPWHYQPPAVITKLKVNGHVQTLPKKGPLLLPVKTKSLSFEFAGLDYSSPQKLHYAYQLVGYDDEWIETNVEQRTTTYTNLPPGEYTFKIKTTDRHGNWSDKQASLPFVQRAAWFQTLWFKLALFIIICLGFYLILRYRLHRLHEQKLVLQKRVDRRTADILMLSEVGKELTASHCMQEVGNKLYQKLSKVMPIDSFLLGMVTEEHDQINFPTVIESGELVDSFLLSMDDDKRFAVQSIMHAQEFIFSSKAEVEQYCLTNKLKSLSDEIMSSVIYEPLIIKGKTIGVLSIQSHTANAFSKTNINMLRTLASYTAVAVDNVRAYEQVANKNEALNQAVKRLEALTYTDQLTGAHNRRFIDKHLDQALELLKRQRQSNTTQLNQDYGFLLIDIDHFKHVNDTYGHEAGDKVLCQLVEIITGACRQSDWVVRWGGEEFLIVCKYTERSFLNKTAERIRTKIAQHPFDLGNDKFIHCTCSIGLSAIPSIKNNFQSITWQQSLNIADIALYTAKANGRNAWVELYYNSENNNVIPYGELISNIQRHVDQQNIILSTSIKDKTIAVKSA